METNEQVKLDWFEVEIDSLPPQAQRLYQSMTELNQQAANRRKELEAIVRERAATANQIPAGHEAIFNYRYGKMSLAFKPYGSVGKTKAVKSTFKLA